MNRFRVFLISSLALQLCAAPDCAPVARSARSQKVWRQDPRLDIHPSVMSARAAEAQAAVALKMAEADLERARKAAQEAKLQARETERKVYGALSAKGLTEKLQAEAKEARKEAEAARKEAEDARKEAEDARKDAEKARKDAEIARKQAEEACREAKAAAAAAHQAARVQTSKEKQDMEAPAVEGKAGETQ